MARLTWLVFGVSAIGESRDGKLSPGWFGPGEPSSILFATMVLNESLPAASSMIRQLEGLRVGLIFNF